MGPTSPDPEPRSKRPGNVDSITGDVISGWAWDPLNPDEPVLVDIFDGADLLLRVRADKYREDLKAAGVGNGRHAFRIPNPSVLLPFARHRIAVRRAKDGVDLSGSPQWLLRPERGLDSSLLDLLDAACEATPWNLRPPEELDSRIARILQVLAHLLDARRSAESRGAAGDLNLQHYLTDTDVSDWLRELIAKVQSDFSPLAFERNESPLVSIIIPAYNKFKVTYNSLKSICENPPNCSFEIVLVDDC